MYTASFPTNFTHTHCHFPPACSLYPLTLCPPPLSVPLDTMPPPPTPCTPWHSAPPAPCTPWLCPPDIHWPRAHLNQPLQADALLHWQRGWDIPVCGECVWCVLYCVCVCVCVCLLSTSVHIPRWSLILPFVSRLLFYIQHTVIIIHTVYRPFKYTQDINSVAFPIKSLFGTQFLRV